MNTEEIENIKDHMKDVLYVTELFNFDEPIDWKKESSYLIKSFNSEEEGREFWKENCKNYHTCEIHKTGFNDKGVFIFEHVALIF